MKIAVYAISKNESKFVETFCKSAADADCIVIADTGSTDDTVQVARNFGAQVYDIRVMPWRFDHARNVALSMVPADVDVCISLDLDEQLEPGWREEIERLWTSTTTRMRYFFDWSCGIKFKAEKIHSRSGYRWHHPCHEQIVPDSRVVEEWVETDRLLVTHHPDPTKSRGQYLDLLALSVREDPHCPRNAFYYARELVFVGENERGIQELNRYLNLPNSTWLHERSYAYRMMGKAYLALGNETEAEKALRKASLESPDAREPWCALAQMYYQRKEWPDCFASARRAASITHRSYVYTEDPEAWESLPHDLVSIAAWNLGMRDIALSAAKEAALLAPDDERIQANVKLMSKQTGDQ
jgi:glycosyltransferase involved in cell wall biosynthesis